MARTSYAWGIDIGKCALKAVRCRMSAEPRKIEADAFDYIEYPMILTQPEADPVELVRAALVEFIGRNKLQGDRVAVAVPGQLGLTKFIKLPPIEAKKIPDIVKYEARQQIPFPLDQVVWDWQRLAGGIEESGFVLDAEVGVFAMKREQVFKALAPLTSAGIEVDVLQLSPIALANMVMFDQLPDPATLDPDSPPPSVVLVSTGVDSTDLVITNGFRIWQRSMPIGGSNFTKALVQGMKLTFAKAEQLKRNAVRAEDPKAVFNTMKPVFNEFASELQRSLNYFTGADRSAKIGKVLLLGNATKLRGLSDFVAKQLNLDVQRLDAYRGLEGAVVTSAAAFKDNRLSFGTAYGLALQAAGGAGLNTNLLPGEIIRERLIAAKKPWAVGAMVGLLGAAAVSFMGMFFAWSTYAPDLYADAFAKADAAKTRSQAAISGLEETRKKQTDAVAQQQFLVQTEDHRFQVLDMLRAVETLLPHDDPANIPVFPGDRYELHIDSMDCQYFNDLAPWFTALQEQWTETHPAEEIDEEQPAAPVDPAAAPPEGGAVAEGTAAPAVEKGPSGPGWVIQLTGHHYHNEDHHKPDDTAQFVRSTIVQGLMGKGDQVLVAAGPLAGQKVPVAELGLGYPVIVNSANLRLERVAASGGGPQQPTSFATVDSEENIPPQGGFSGVPVPSAPGLANQGVELKRFDFTLQFTWQPTVPGAPKPAPSDTEVAVPNTPVRSRAAPVMAD
ncbi:MAG: type IV pilus assembly protein PilM [Planctomycetota bacterium]